VNSGKFVAELRRGNIYITIARELLEIIAENLSNAGWSWGCVGAIDCDWGRIWIVDAHRDNGKRFVVRADEKLTAFMEREAAIRRLKANYGL